MAVDSSFGHAMFRITRTKMSCIKQQMEIIRQKFAESEIIICIIIVKKKKKKKRVIGDKGATRDSSVN
jgi:hypothetical protein